MELGWNSRQYLRVNDLQQILPFTLRISAAGSSFPQARPTPQVVKEPSGKLPSTQKHRKLYAAVESPSLEKRETWGTRHLCASPGDGHSSALTDQILILPVAKLKVCDGVHWLNVMNERDGVKRT